MKKQEAIKYFGSPKKLADALEISKSSVSQWGEEPPLVRQYQIQEITEGKLTVGKTVTA